MAWAVLAGAAAAQTADSGWPDRPLRLIVPFPAGASTDIVARIVAQKLGSRLGQQVVIENRAGASGNIGADALAKAAPDGYTLGIATASTHAVAASLSAALPYDPLKDFAPVAMLGGQPYVLVLYPGVPARNLAELVALAKAKPRQLNYGSAGVASLAHLATALFASMAGIEITHVPYKSEPESITAILGKQIHLCFINVSTALPLIKEGRLRALAITSATRQPELPQVPTMIEGGVAGYVVTTFVGVAARVGTPADIVGMLNGTINQVLASAEMQANFFARLGVRVSIGTPQEFAAFIAAETRKWTAVATDAGIRID